MGWTNGWLGMGLVCAAVGCSSEDAQDDDDDSTSGPGDEDDPELQVIDAQSFCEPTTPVAFGELGTFETRPGLLGLCGHLAFATETERHLVALDGTVDVLGPGTFRGLFARTGRVLFQNSQPYPSDATLQIIDPYTLESTSLDIPQGIIFDPYGAVISFVRDDRTWAWACAGDELFVGGADGMAAIAAGVECKQVFGASHAPVLIYAALDGRLTRVDLDTDETTAVDDGVGGPIAGFVESSSKLGISADGTVISIEDRIVTNPGTESTDLARTRIRLFDVVLDDVVVDEDEPGTMNEPLGADSPLLLRFSGAHVVRFGLEDGTEWVYTRHRELEALDPDDVLQTASAAFGPALVTSVGPTGVIVERFDVAARDVLDTIGTFPAGEVELTEQGGTVVVVQQSDLCVGDCSVPVWSIWVHKGGALTGPRHVHLDRSTSNYRPVAIANADGEVIVDGGLLPDGVDQSDLDSGTSPVDGVCYWNDGAVDSCLAITPTPVDERGLRAIGSAFVHQYSGSGMGVELVHPPATSMTPLAAGGQINVVSVPDGGVPVVALEVAAMFSNALLPRDYYYGAL